MKDISIKSKSNYSDDLTIGDLKQLEVNNRVEPMTIEKYE